MPTHLFSFFVEGGGVFPIDMLRYDSAWPASERDSYLIAESLEQGVGRRTIELNTVSQTAPTFGRWESFGWKAKWTFNE